MPLHTVQGRTPFLILIIIFNSVHSQNLILAHDQQEEFSYQT